MSDIRGTLELIRQRLDEFLANAAPRRDDWVILSNLGDAAGNPYEAARGKLVMSLAGVERETTVSTFRPTVPVEGGAYAAVAPPLYVDLFLLFYANFSDSTYAEGLAVLARAISFFQQNPQLTHDSLPGLDPRIDRLSFEMVNLDLSAWSHLMDLAGVKYLPSVYYKLRLIPFASRAFAALVPAVQGTEAPADLADVPPPVAPV